MMSMSKDAKVDLLDPSISERSCMVSYGCKKTFLATGAIGFPLLSLMIGIYLTSSPALVCIACINGIFISMGILQ